MMKSRLFFAAASLVLALAGAPAQAGRSCLEHAPSVDAVSRGLALAQKTLEALESSGAAVVLLARAGQDLSKYGIEYSHFGIAYRAREAGGPTSWRVLHKLNHCGTNEAAVYVQGLGEFFLIDPWRYRSSWIVPSPAAQKRLLKLLEEPQRALSLHSKPYSVVSYAWGQKYQQSNQWALETLALAMDDGVYSRTGAQRWLRDHSYQPAVLYIDPLTRLGGRITAANVAFDDHPNRNRFSDRIETITVDSVFQWMQRAQLAADVPVYNRTVWVY